LVVFGHVSILESSPQTLGIGDNGGFQFVIFDAKGCVILDDSVWHLVGHWKTEKNIFGNPSEMQLGTVTKTEAIVIDGIANKDASFCTDCTQVFQAVLNQLLADSLSLHCRQNAERTENIPRQLFAVNRDERCCDMPDDILVDFCYERNSQSSVCTQGIDDEVFRLMAERVVSKCGFVNRADGLKIMNCFWSDVQPCSPEVVIACGIQLCLQSYMAGIC